VARTDIVGLAGYGNGSTTPLLGGMDEKPYAAFEVIPGGIRE
jgi:hypothetical protein